MSNTGGFQTLGYTQPAAAVAGDFADSNDNRFSVIAGPGGLVAGVGGVTIGAFAWTSPPVDPNETNQIAYSFGSIAPAGLVGRNQQGQNSTFLSFAGMTILQGYPVTIYNSVDMWVVNNGSTYAAPGMKAYANFSNGLVTFAAAGAPTTAASATTSSIAAATSSVTGSIADDVLTVTAVLSGTVYPGTTLSGTGVSSGTKVVSQVSGTAGGVGTYLVSIGGQAATSTTISGTYGVFTIGTLTTSGPFTVGQLLNATGAVVAGTTITANLTGTGGTGGTMVVDNNTVVSSQTISAVSNIETKWYARSGGAAGAIIKISNIPSGGAVAS
jgi:hypothetical protein